MDTMISQLQHILVVVCAVILALSLAAVFTAAPFIRWITRYTPQDRLALLKLYAVFPLLGGITAGAMIVLPSLSHALNFAVDHCHDVNACWWREEPHNMSLKQALIISLVAGSALWAGFIAFVQWQRSRRLGAQIVLGSCGSMGPDVKLIDSDCIIALSAGLLRPFAVISTGLARSLPADQLAIVCLHERLHAHNRDNWSKWLFNLLGMFHWAGVRQSLRNEHALALELRVDEQVAEQVDNRIAVAETIIAVQRLVQDDQQTMPVCYFAGSSTERRVQHLLSGNGFFSLPRRIFPAIFLGGAAIAMCTAVHFHDVFETLLI